MSKIELTDMTIGIWKTTFAHFEKAERTFPQRIEVNDTVFLHGRNNYELYDVLPTDKTEL